MMNETKTYELDDIDRRLIKATQGGLPLTTRPYAELAQREGMTEFQVMDRMKRMLDSGVIRRIAAVPNHYRIGFRANGMTVWDVTDEKIDELGAKIGDLEFVSHCYRRPRHAGVWSYNLFAMVHGKNREEVAEKAQKIRQILGQDCRAFDILYSKRILKKTGFRMGE